MNKSQTQPPKAIGEDLAMRSNFTVRMEIALQQAARIQAVNERRSLSDLVTDAIRLYLQQAS